MNFRPHTRISLKQKRSNKPSSEIRDSCSCIGIGNGLDCRLDPSFLFMGYYFLSILFLLFVPKIQKIKGTTDQWANYHNQDELETILIDINKRCSNYTALYSIGESVEGHVLLVIQFSTTPGQHQMCTLLFTVSLLKVCNV